MYKLEILTLNTNANAKFFSKWLKDNYTYFNGMALGWKVVIYFTTEPSPIEKAEINDKYISLTAEDVLTLENIISVYEVRAADGVNYYDQVRGSLALEYNAGTLPIEHASYIEHKMIVVKSFLLTGDWATAQFEMNNKVVVDGIVSQEDIDNGFTQERYDNIKINIDTYVSEHYT